MGEVLTVDGRGHSTTHCGAARVRGTEPTRRRPVDTGRSVLHIGGSCERSARCGSRTLSEHEKATLHDAIIALTHEELA